MFYDSTETTSACGLELSRWYCWTQYLVIQRETHAAFQTRDSTRIPSSSNEALERERSKFERVSVYQAVNFIHSHARSSSVSAFEVLG
jgi:hypothetical protein